MKSLIVGLTAVILPLTASADEVFLKSSTRETGSLPPSTRPSCAEDEQARARQESETRVREAEARAAEAEARARQAEAEAQQPLEGLPLWYGWGAGPTVWPSGPIIGPSVPSRPAPRPSVPR